MRSNDISLLSTFGEEPRGVNVYSEGLLAGLRSNGITPSIFDYRKLYPTGLVPAESMSSTVMDKTSILHWRRPGTWRRVADRSSRLLHIQYWSPFTAPMLYHVCRHAKRRGKKVVLTVHNPRPHERLPVFGGFEKALIRSVDSIIVHNEMGRDLLMSSKGAPSPDRVFVIPHGVDIRRHEHSAENKIVDAEAASLSPIRRYVLMFGNLRGYKGVPTLLDAWARVVRQVDDVDLVLAGRLWDGGGSLSGRAVAWLLKTHRVGEEIKERLSDPDLSGRVILKEGFIPDELLDTYCRVATLAVFPYERFSGQSGAATRAAGWGLPIVVSRVGALPQLVDNNLQLFEPGNAEELADRLCKLLDEPSSLAAVNELQNNRVRAFGWNEVAHEHMKLYRKVLNPG